MQIPRVQHRNPKHNPSQVRPHCVEDNYPPTRKMYHPEEAVSWEPIRDRVDPQAYSMPQVPHIEQREPVIGQKRKQGEPRSHMHIGAQMRCEIYSPDGQHRFM